METVKSILAFIITSKFSADPLKKIDSACEADNECETNCCDHSTCLIEADCRIDRMGELLIFCLFAIILILLAVLFYLCYKKRKLENA
jgi:hypothetical protein